MIRVISFDLFRLLRIRWGIYRGNALLATIKGAGGGGGGQGTGAVLDARRRVVGRREAGTILDFTLICNAWLGSSRIPCFACLCTICRHC